MPTLKVTTRDAGEAVEIRVRDNGTGIPADIRDKLFQPFFTTKPTGEGTGLGLSITYDIVTQQHGGTSRSTARSANTASSRYGCRASRKLEVRRRPDPTLSGYSHPPRHPQRDWIEALAGLSIWTGW